MVSATPQASAARLVTVGNRLVGVFGFLLAEGQPHQVVAEWLQRRFSDEAAQNGGRGLGGRIGVPAVVGGAVFPGGVNLAPMVADRNTRPVAVVGATLGAADTLAGGPRTVAPTYVGVGRRSPLASESCAGSPAQLVRLQFLAAEGLGLGVPPVARRDGGAGFSNFLAAQREYQHTTPGAQDLPQGRIRGALVRASVAAQSAHVGDSCRGFEGGFNQPLWGGFGGQSLGRVTGVESWLGLVQAREWGALLNEVPSIMLG